MFRKLALSLARFILGAASRAGRQQLDADARLALTPRVLEGELQLHATAETGAGPKRVGHLLVYEGGRKDVVRFASGPLGGPEPVSTGDGSRRARRA